jgi:hypothetical protein
VAANARAAGIGLVRIGSPAIAIRRSICRSISGDIFKGK